MFQGNAWKVESNLEMMTSKEWIEFACGANISAAEYYRCHRNITFSRQTDWSTSMSRTVPRRWYASNLIKTPARASKVAY